jgi:hypothetical protein
MSESACDWEREERRCAIEAAEAAGELDDRPTLSDFRDEDEDVEEGDDER